MTNLPSSDEHSAAPNSLAPWKRLAGCAIGWAAIVGAGPGMLSESGNLPLAILGVALWGTFAARPGRFAFALEWVVASVGLGAQFWWLSLAFLPTALATALALGFYLALGGALLRRLATRLPLSLAIALAFTAAECLRSMLPLPLGFGGLRLGHLALDLEWLAGSARVWGMAGVGWILAGVGGGLAELWVSRRVRALALPLGLLLLGAAATRLVPVPATEAGPSFLLVQPNIEHSRKALLGEAKSIRRLSLALTQAGLEANRAAGRREPDLVAWAETMLLLRLFDSDLREAVARGARTEPWELPLKADVFDRLEALERNFVHAPLFGSDPTGSGEPLREALLGPNTAFLSGLEFYAAQGDWIRRRNAAALWSPDGKRSEVVGKQRLLPGLESMLGLESRAELRQAVFEVAGTVPDVWPFESLGAVGLERPDSEPWMLGISMSLDSAREDGYFRLSGGIEGTSDVDLHLILADDQLYDASPLARQMLASARSLAVSTARSVVRVSNSGVSAAFGPDGAELGRIRDGEGRDVGVEGFLCVEVPTPVRREAELPSTTPHFRMGRLGPWIWLLAAGFCALIRQKNSSAGH